MKHFFLKLGLSFMSIFVFTYESSALCVVIPMLYEINYKCTCTLYSHQSGEHYDDTFTDVIYSCATSERKARRDAHTECKADCDDAVNNSNGDLQWDVVTTKILDIEPIDRCGSPRKCEPESLLDAHSD